MTGHTEVVKVFFDPLKVGYEELLLIFWEAHDPTQGMRQGNDVGTQYRSAIYVTDSQQKVTALDSQKVFQEALTGSGHSQITTEIDDLQTFYYADDFHQQYLAKNPNGYCGLSGTGVCYAKKSSE
jgi:peptide-methionine (S)-S-oxide reductase